MKLGDRVRAFKKYKKNEDKPIFFDKEDLLAWVEIGCPKLIVEKCHKELFTDRFMNCFTDWNTGEIDKEWIEGAELMWDGSGVDYIQIKEVDCDQTGIVVGKRSMKSVINASMEDHPYWGYDMMFWDKRVDYYLVAIHMRGMIKVPLGAIELVGE